MSSDNNTQNVQHNNADSTMRHLGGDFALQNTGESLTPQEYAKMEEFVKLSFDFARLDDADSLKIMLDNGLNPNLANHKGDTLLMLASYHNAIACVKLLLVFGANVDKPNDKGHTPLAGVCFKGYTEVAKLLLEYGASPSGVGNEMLSPINTAIMFRRKDILKLLLKFYNKKLGFWQRLFSRL